MNTVEPHDFLRKEADWVCAIHRFWFGDQGVYDEDYRHLFARWYRGKPAFDAEIRTRFEPRLHEVVHAHQQGELAAWNTSPRACCALVILLDQMSRNMYRGSATMFAFDAISIALVHRALQEDWYGDLAPVEQLFLAVALEHSEQVDDVERSATLLADLAQRAPKPQAKRFASMCKYNRDHLQTVRRFGRYPHRNELLGRTSTEEEQAFLQRVSFRWMRSVYHT